MNTIKILDPSLIENATKKIGKATENNIAQIIGRVEKNWKESPQLSWKRPLKNCTKHLFVDLVNFHVKKCLYSENWTLLKVNFQQKTKDEEWKTDLISIILFEWGWDVV